MRRAFLKQNKILQASIYMCLLVAMIFLLYLFGCCYKISSMAMDNYFVIEYSQKGDLKENLKKIKLNNFEAVTVVLATNCGVMLKNAELEIALGRAPESAHEVLTGSMDVEIGSVINYNGKAFKVVGYILTTSQYVFHNSFEFDEAEAVGIVLKAKPFRNHDLIEKELSKIFANDSLYAPDNPSFWDLIKDIPLIAGMIIYLIFSLTPIPIAVIYLLRKYEKIISVYRFLGFTPKYIIKKLSKIYLIVIASIFVLSNLAYLTLEKVWINNIVSVMGVYSLKFTDYLLADLAFLGIMLIFSLPVIRQIKTIKVDYNCD